MLTHFQWFVVLVDIEIFRIRLYNDVCRRCRSYVEWYWVYHERHGVQPVLCLVLVWMFCAVRVVFLASSMQNSMLSLKVYSTNQGLLAESM